MRNILWTIVFITLCIPTLVWLKVITVINSVKKIMRYSRAWIDKYIRHIESPSAHWAGWKYEWDLLTKGVNIPSVEEILEEAEKCMK